MQRLRRWVSNAGGTGATLVRELRPSVAWPEERNHRLPCKPSLVSLQRLADWPALEHAVSPTDTWQSEPRLRATRLSALGRHAGQGCSLSWGAAPLRTQNRYPEDREPLLTLHVDSHLVLMEIPLVQ